MKTIIFYVRKGAREAKQQGLATAPGSAVTIRTLSQMALRGDGRLYIVDAPTAEHGRRLSQLTGQNPHSTSAHRRPRPPWPTAASWRLV